MECRGIGVWESWTFGEWGHCLEPRQRPAHSSLFRSRALFVESSAQPPTDGARLNSCKNR
jgi:hypothetical protein